jgi:hypothetical protein
MKNNINESAYFERMRQLADVDKKLIKESKNSTLLDYKEAGDGRVYGIVKENANYFIKTAIKKDNINESDFAYIGGLSNITEYKCKSLTEAQRVLNTKVMTVNETYGYVKEDEQEEQPAPQPQPEPAPEAPVEPQPEQPVDDVAPAPAPAEAPVADDETINQVKSHVGKAGNLLSGIEIPSEKSKQVIKMFLGYFNIEGMSDEDKNEIARMFRPEENQMEEAYLKEMDEFMMTPENVAAILAGVAGVFGVAGGIAGLMDKLKTKNPKLAKEVENIAKSSGSGIKGGITSMDEGYLKEDVDQQTIEMIISGIGALATIGLGFAIDPLKRLLSRTSVGKKIVDNLEGAGSGAGDATRSGMSKGSYTESDEYLTEEDELEDDILDSMPEEPMDTPEMMDEPMDIEVKSGEKKVSIDLNAGTVDVNLSEAKVRELAKKYNVSESYIKWKIRDIMNEEIEKTEKGKLKEEKVRKVVRNIIMEKLGLKKKPLNESVSKERLKLEKLVESVLKKNIK